MRIRRKQPYEEQQPSTAEANVEPTSQPVFGDPALPGSAGYRGAEPLAKNAMPQSRFNFVRPDGKR